LKRKELLILDVSSYIFRAYHATPPFTNSKGEQINAIFGFINMYLKIADKFQDFHIIAALDSKRSTTFRKEMYPEYKANRKEIDEELRVQFQYIEPMLDALNIPSIAVEGYEADDIIAAIATNKSDYNVKIISSDKDLMQLVDDRVNLYDSMKNKIYDIEAVTQKFAVPPSKLHDLLALMGDASDNIPGLPGIGIKTGAKLLINYQNIDGIYKNIDELPKKQQQKFTDFKDQLNISWELIDLKKDIKIDVEPSKWPGINEVLFLSFAKEHNFKTLIKKFDLKEEPADIPIMENSDFSIKSCSELYILKEKSSFLVSDGTNYKEYNNEPISQNTTVFTFNAKETFSSPFP